MSPSCNPVGVVDVAGDASLIGGKPPADGQEQVGLGRHSLGGAHCALVTSQVERPQKVMGLGCSLGKGYGGQSIWHDTQSHAHSWRTSK